MSLLNLVKQKQVNVTERNNIDDKVRRQRSLIIQSMMDMRRELMPLVNQPCHLRYGSDRHVDFLFNEPVPNWKADVKPYRFPTWTLSVRPARPQAAFPVELGKLDITGSTKTTTVVDFNCALKFHYCCFYIHSTSATIFWSSDRLDWSDELSQWVGMNQCMEDKVFPKISEFLTDQLVFTNFDSPEPAPPVVEEPERRLTLDDL